jgi:beta-galactosidase
MITSAFNRTIWHGADYNPEQWLETPEILREDLRLMELAGMSSATVGIFSWAMLEPREGEFNFAWLDEVFENLARNGQKIVLATPSGAKPHWMANKYPEIRRVAPNGIRNSQQGRHNHCFTSPVYREKTALIDGELARRYGAHPSLLAWHISNEFSGECSCDLCFNAFRGWLKKRYDNDLDALNRLYWSRFWSHSYSTWEEIDFIDAPVHGLSLDWRRFVTDQTVSFMKNEIDAIRVHSQIPATTNMMGSFTQVNYEKFAPHLDFISWDSYPQWGGGEMGGDETSVAIGVAFEHDYFRSLKKSPFWLMECTPSQTNWRPISRLKAPGLHRLSALQTLAHGGDAVMYFQWRQSRGSSEKFHGAVVSHEGSENNRVFKEVAALGHELKQLAPLADSRAEASVALIYDVENLWAIWGEQGPRNEGKNPVETLRSFYEPFWKRGISVDIIASTADLSSYKLVLAPMLYLLRPGVAEKLTDFVRGGGTLVTTYMTGYADENDLCFLGGFPGPLREVLGLWVEETDTLHPHQRNKVIVNASELGFSGHFEAVDYCDLIHPETARVLGTYERDFYAGRAALTVNDFGEGQAYYVASRNESAFQFGLLESLIDQLDLDVALQGEFEAGVNTQRRVGGGFEWIFVLNFDGDPRTFTPAEDGFERLEGENWLAIDGGERQRLAPYDVAILKRSL